MGNNKTTKSKNNKPNKPVIRNEASADLTYSKIPYNASGRPVDLPRSEFDDNEDPIKQGFIPKQFHGTPLPGNQETSAASIRIPKKVEPKEPSFQKPYRSLRDVSYQELKDAVAKMANELGIHGSGGDYSLYNAVARERARISPDDPDTKVLYPEGVNTL